MENFEDQDQPNRQKGIKPGVVETIDIPAKFFSKKTGFSLDMGGSMVKLVYSTDEGANVRFHFVSYPRPRMEEVIELLKQLYGDTLKGQTFNCCGVGIYQHKKVFDETLGIEINNESEMDCFVNAYRFMSANLPIEQITHSPGVGVEESIYLRKKQLMATFKGLETHGDQAQIWDIASETGNEKDNKRTDVKSGVEKDIEERKSVEAMKSSADEIQNKPVDSPSQPKLAGQFPVLLCMLGSGGLTMKVFEDGTYNMIDGSSRCGRMLLGLGRLLTGAKDYEELIDLAGRGDREKLCVYGKHLKTATEAQTTDIYTEMAEDFELYSFGHAAYMEKDNFSREDKAAAVLGVVCQDVQQMCHLSSLVAGTKKIVLCGGFPGSPLVRDTVWKELGLKLVANSMGVQGECYFLKFGGYYGALGALLRSVLDNENTVDTHL